MNKFHTVTSIHFKPCEHHKDFNFRYFLEGAGKTEGF